MAAAVYPLQMAGGVPVITTPAEIDATTAGELRAVLSERQNQGQTLVVVDMTGTEFCDSAGLRELVWAHKRAVADGGGLLLVMTGEGAVARLFAITGLDHILPRFASLALALAQASATTVRRPGRGAAAPRSVTARRRRPATVNSAARPSRPGASAPGSALLTAAPPGTVSTSATRPPTPARSPGHSPP
jgi:anti-sigma B factor antagonist